MANKKWTEVSQPFQFPPSFTSKSFTLRKMYSRLLHDYEQVYFHRNRGQPLPPPGKQPQYGSPNATKQRTLDLLETAKQLLSRMPLVAMKQRQDSDCKCHSPYLQQSCRNSRQTRGAACVTLDENEQPPDSTPEAAKTATRYLALAEPNFSLTVLQVWMEAK